MYQILLNGMRIGTVAVFGLLLSCHDAPKSNPFDPVSGDIKTLDGDYTIRSQEDLAALTAEGGRAFEIAGTLSLEVPFAASLDGLRNLVSVGGDLLLGPTVNQAVEPGAYP